MVMQLIARSRKASVSRKPSKICAKSGYEPHLNLKLEIGLQEITFTGQTGEFSENLELELTDEDVRTLRRMKIKF